MPPFFSVVIPTYNCANLLNRALKSVFSQTFQDFEIIVVDNSSTDKTDHVLNKFSDIRLKIIKVNNNGIISISRNKGIEESKGTWIAFLDSDDRWLPEKLETVRKSIINDSEVISVCHNEWHIDNGKNIKKLNYGYAGDDLYESLLFYGNCMSTSAVSIKSEIAKISGGFSIKEEFVTVEDYEYWIRLSQLGKVLFLNKVLGEWHTHGANYSGDTILHVNAFINVMNHHFSIYKQQRDILYKKLNKGRSKYLGIAANLLRQDKFYNEAIHYSKTGLMTYPLFWKNWVILVFSYIGKYFHKLSYK